MRILDDVYMLDSVRGSHVFLVSGAENVLIDTGMPGNAGKIADELERLGVAVENLGTILLTHHDVDHMGSAKALQDMSGAALWAPAKDVPYVTGEKKRQGVKGVVSAVIRPLIPTVTGTYDSRSDFGGIKAIAAPGHTPGHTIFKYGNVVFSGDLLRHLHGRFNLLPSFMNWYLRAAKESLGLLKTMDFEWLCPSHGQPAPRDEALNKFLEKF